MIKKRLVEFSLENNKLRMLLALLSGIWLFLISPPSSISYSAWFAYVPILWLSSISSPRDSFKLGFIFGFVGNFLIFYWLIDTISIFSDIESVYAVLIVLLYALVLAIPMGLFSLATNYCWKNIATGWIIVVPALLVVVEYFSQFIALFPYQHGMSQFENLAILQISSITGNWGVSYLILLVNVFITTLVIFATRKNEIKPLFFPWYYAGGIAVILLLVVTFGVYRVDEIESTVADMPTISVLQLQDRVPAKDWVEKNTNKRLKAQLSNYWYHQTELFKEDVDWIIWPESSVSKNIEAHFHQQNLQNLAKKKNSFISLGGVGRSKNLLGKAQLFNSVFSFSNEGEYLGRYDKQKLVPFSEYTPFADTFGFKNLVSGFTAGAANKIFAIHGVKVAFPICYEAIFQSSYRAFSDAELIANLSNDIWFVNSRGRELHAMISQIRAIEFGVPILRVGYTGLSFYVKPNGQRIFDLPPDSKQQRIIKIAYGKIPTFYAKWGDWFVFLCGLMIIMTFAVVKIGGVKVSSDVHQKMPSEEPVK